jgi:CheY-like chemotaxis protein
MPGMTGAELTRQLRRQIPRLPALIVSGYAEAETVAPELHRLAKPFRASELAESLSAVRKEYNGWPALDDPTSP